MFSQRERFARAAVLLAAVAAAGFAPPTAEARDMGPGTVVGRVTDRSSKLKSRKIQVMVGRQKWTLHLAGTTVVYHNRRKVSVHEIDLGMWIRASGTRIGKLRLDVERLDIAGDRAAYQKSDAYRPGQPDGYFVARRYDR